MIDLSYTNKDGVNLFEGFDNGFNYHRDGKESGDGYEHGGYPEITGETSPYTDTSYKTGDNPDFFNNGNVWEQPPVNPGPGPEPGPGRTLSINGVFRRCETGAVMDGPYDEIRINYGDYSVTCSNPTFHEWKKGLTFFGNSELLSYWGYDGEPVGSDYRFCLVAGSHMCAFVFDEDYVEGQNFYGTFIKGNTTDAGLQGPISNYVSFSGTGKEHYSHSRKEIYDVNLIAYDISEEDMRILMNHNEYGANVTFNGEKRVVPIIAYQYEENGQTLSLAILDGITGYEVSAANNYIYAEDKYDEHDFYASAVLDYDYKQTLTDMTIDCSIDIDLDNFVAPPALQSVKVNAVAQNQNVDVEYHPEVVLEATYEDGSKMLISCGLGEWLDYEYPYPIEEAESWISGEIQLGETTATEIKNVATMTFSPAKPGDVVFESESDAPITETVTYRGKSATFTLSPVNIKQDVLGN